MKAAIKILLKLAVVAGMFYFILRRIPFSQIVDAAAGARGGMLAAALLINGVSRYISAYQSSLLFRVYRVRFPAFSIFRITLASGFYGFFAPGELGSALVKWYKLSTPENRKAEAFIVIFIAKLMSLFLTFGLGFLGLALENPFRSSPFNGTAAVFFALTALLLFSLFHPSFLPVVRRRLQTGIPGRARDKMTRAADMIATAQRLPRHQLLGLFLLTVAGHLTCMLSLYLIAVSLGITVPGLSFLWLNSIALLAQMLPFSFSGLGIREGAIYLLLGRYGVAGGLSVAFSLLIFAMTVFFNLVGGLSEFAVLLKSRTVKGNG